MKSGNIFILTHAYICIAAEAGGICELDLGCGKGGFTRSLAVKYPERKIFAADVMIGRIRRLEKRINILKIPNIELLRVEAWNLIAYSLPDESIDRIHIICPDPWPKNKHKGNRLLSSEFIGRLLRVLKKNGVVHFATDDSSCFDSVTALFSMNSSYRRNDSEIADISEIKSDFETKWESAGLKVTHAAWVKIQL